VKYLFTVMPKGNFFFGQIGWAPRIEERYICVMPNTYAANNNLWEKYTVAEGNVNVTNEHKMAPMICRTAGTFIWSYN